MTAWLPAFPLSDLEEESVRRFDHGGRTFAIYRMQGDEVFCSQGLCSHEAVHLADGLAMDYEIECPKHSGVFDVRTGEARRLPACVNLRVYPARVADGRIEIDLGDQAAPTFPSPIRNAPAGSGGCRAARAYGLRRTVARRMVPLSPGSQARGSTRPLGESNGCFTIW